jgi:hypothetical protein
MMSAAASLGPLLLWDTDMGLNHIDKYTYASEEHIKVPLFCFGLTFSDAYAVAIVVWRFTSHRSYA